MSKHTYNIRTGDAPVISDNIDGNLTINNASVNFSMKPVVARGEITIDSVDATIGQYDDETDTTEVSYQVSSTDTQSAEDYLAEFEVTYGDGEVLTYPRGRYYFISIEESI